MTEKKKYRFPKYKSVSELIDYAINLERDIVLEALIMRQSKSGYSNEKKEERFRELEMKLNALIEYVDKKYLLALKG